MNTAILIQPATDAALLAQADALSKLLDLPVLLEESLEQTAHELQLVVTPKRLELHWAEPQQQQLAASKKKSKKPAKPVTGSAIYADWSSLNIASAAGTSLKQPIAKALGLKPHHTPPLRVIDTTAGWGEDAWVMASLGCHVLMVERCPIMVAMLEDALNRQRAYSPITVSHLRVVHDDAATLLGRLAQGQSLASQHPQALTGSVWGAQGDASVVAAAADVIHLDPMFPGEKTSAERKPMRLLRALAGDDADASILWDAAMEVGVKRVVVKRPPHGQPLGGKPDMAVTGKASRYDIYHSHAQND